MTQPDALGIAALSIVYVASTLFLNQRYGGRARLKQLQKEMQDYQKQVKDATEKKDEHAIARLQAREKEVAGTMTEMMTLPLKSLIFVLPLFFLFIGFSLFDFHFPGIVPGIFPTFTIVLPIDLHLPALFSLNIMQPSVYGPRGFFIVCSLFAGIIVEALYSKIESRRAAAKA